MKKYLLSVLVILILNVDVQAQQYRRVDKNLDIFYKLNPTTKISLFFSQPGYIAGDTAYFLARLVNSVDLKPVKKKVTLHLILVNKDGQKAVDQFFFVVDGSAPNQIIIPLTLQPGIYKLLCLRESTNDFNKEIYYQQDFEIGAVHKKVVVDTARSISIFPEGGSILEDTENKIFVSGHPAGSLTLRLFDGLNREVKSFTTNSSGIGFFFLKAMQGQTFYLSGILNGKLIKTFLPATGKLGISFNSIVENGKLRVKGKALGIKGKPEILLIKNDRVYYAEKLRLDSSYSFSNEISLGETLTGLFQLWIVDKNTALASRILYYDAGNESEVLDIKHALQAHPRNKVEIILEKNDSLMNGNFSVRIYQKALFPLNSRNVFSDLELFNDFQPQRSTIQHDRPVDSINDFLVTRQWQRYNIDSLVKGKFKTGRVSFDRTYTISGTCKSAANLNLQQPAIVTLYFENSNFIEEAPLAKNGNFYLELTEPISLHEKVYYRIDVNEKELADAKLEITDVDTILPIIQAKSTNEPNPYFSYKILTDSIQRSYNYFANESKPTISKPGRRKSLEAKSYGADLVYKLSDYQVFSTMKDVVVEIMAKATFRKINGKDAVRVYLEDNQTSVLAKGDPLFIIDGIPTNNTDFFLALKPSKIDKIKIIWKVERSVLKSFGRNGVIIVESKEASVPANIPALNSFSLPGFSSSLPFWAPRDLSDRRVPYFRSCLYWDPSVKFDKDGVCKLSVFTSDDLGEYIIDVEGLTADGAPYSHRSSFMIVPEK